MSGFPLAFPGANTPAPARGIARGHIQRFSFVVSRQGRYAIVCSVGHHARAGMWDTFEVTAGGDASLGIPQ